MDPKLTSPKSGREEEDFGERAEAETALFPIVGVGASAGGLEAFTEFLQQLPSDTGMAFVFVQHLDPTHGSLLVELLCSKTSMTLVEATDGMEVTPNSVYVVPPTKDLAIERGVLRLTPRPSSGAHLPVDAFFTSLARDRKTAAFAVVLSGTAADGAAGVRAVRAEGGATFAQDPATAKFPGMPENAIATGVVDFVLPIPRIAEQLVHMAEHPEELLFPRGGRSVPAVPCEDPLLGELLAVVRSVTQADFTHYKQSTVRRRIDRRMTVHHIEDLAEYVELLRQDPAEVEALFQDLLIHVTSFFRQPQVFETLKTGVFPQIAEAGAGRQVRFWAPGCATGEEAYSLAIAWAEFLGSDHPDKTSFQIFGTDINQQAIDKARAGIYPQSIASDVSPERLAQFFTPVEGGFRVSESLRGSCMFAKHDLTRDPPFAKLDLISVRNVLIYLGPLLQRRVLPVLHFALRPGGFLLLGESESVGATGELFSVFDKKNKIYARREGLVVIPPAPPPAREPGTAVPARAHAPQEFDLSGEADRIVLDSYAPAGVIVDADLQIRHFRGRAEPYLKLGPGRASFDLLRMAREGLAGELRIALRAAERQGASVQRRDIRMLRGGQVVVVGFDVIPIKSPSGEASFLVLFHDMSGEAEKQNDGSPKRPPDAASDASEQIAGLERELGEMREYARSVLEDKESANEELRSANEELLSANEELQSVNEELETTSEEVQSANEELRTLNDELHSANDQLSTLNEDQRCKNAELEELNATLHDRDLELRAARDYAQAVVDTVREPLLVLDADFRVVSASPSFYRMFEADSGATLDRIFFELDGGQWPVGELREALGRACGEGGDFQGFIVNKNFERLGPRTMLLSGRRIHAGVEGSAHVLLAIEDITERARAEVLSNVLDRINLTMVSSLDFGEIVEKAVTEGAEALACDEAFLAVPVSGSWVTRFSWGSPATGPGGAVPAGVAAQLSALTVGQRAVVATSSLERRARGSASDAQTQVVYARLGARDRDTAVGALSFGRRGRKTPFSDAELDFVDKLAPALSLALENATLFSTEQRVAEMLQRRLLRPMASVAGLEVGLAYRPAYAAERVGGDFYDLFPLEDGRAVVVIGDVSGKGVEAASLTETVRAILRTLASFDCSPASILSRANEILLGQAISDQFVTVIFAVIDSVGRRITLSSAGHPPPIVCGPNVRFLESPPGTPLGAMTNGYREAEFDFMPDETLVLYTDGLIEARRGKELFGERRLAEALAAADSADAQNTQKMVDALVSKAREFTGGQMGDDLAVIAARLVADRTPS